MWHIVDICIFKDLHGQNYCWEGFVAQISPAPLHQTTNVQIAFQWILPIGIC